MKCFLSSCLTLVATLIVSQSAMAQNRAPSIDHSPVKVAVRGQNILFRAKVTDDASAIQSVTLFYSVSRDAAPYKVAMNPTGAGVYMGTVSADLTAGLQQLLYYIEAKDTLGAVGETPWYPVEIKTGTPVSSPGPAAKATASPEKESSWKKPALIAGGALAVGGAALAIMGGGGGDSGGGGSGTTTNAAGTYAGTASVYFQPPGGTLVSSTYPITIVINSKGVVTSDNLYEGTHLEGHLSGSSFQLVAPVHQADRNGEIRFIGMVNNNRIAGSVEGSATTSDGNGTYSGSFSAAK